MASAEDISLVELGGDPCCDITVKRGNIRVFPNEIPDNYKIRVVILSLMNYSGFGNKLFL